MFLGPLLQKSTQLRSSDSIFNGFRKKVFPTTLNSHTLICLTLTIWNVLSAFKILSIRFRTWTSRNHMIAEQRGFPFRPLNGFICHEEGHFLLEPNQCHLDKLQIIRGLVVSVECPCQK